MPFNAEGEQRMPEQEVGKNSDTDNPDQKSWGPGWKKEMANSLINRRRPLDKIDYYLI